MPDFNIFLLGRARTSPFCPKNEPSALCRHYPYQRRSAVFQNDTDLDRFAQLGIEDSKGSIAVGRDADFLVFDKDLLTAGHEGFSYNLPRDVYFGGKKLN